MLMPKKNRVAVYEYLFKEGVLVAEKKMTLQNHSDEVKVPNLHVIKALQSLKSKGLVKEQFAWRHYYWYLTNEGIQYLRDFLHLPPEIVPSTLKRQSRPDTARAPRAPRADAAPRPAAADRAEYRKGAPTSDKKADVGPGADGGNFQFRGGFGRGAPPPK